MKTLLTIAVVGALACGALAGGPSDHDLECQACNDAVQLADAALSSQFVHAVLLEAVYGVCGTLNGTTGLLCNTTAGSLLNLTITDVKTILDNACVEHLNCSKPSPLMAFGLTSDTTPSVPCEVFEELYKKVSDPSQLLQMCSMMKSDEQATCKQLVSQYPSVAVQVMQTIVKKIADLIPFLKCQLSADDRKTEMAPSTAGCAACKDFVQILEYALNQSDIKKQLQALLGEECAKLPSNYASACNETVYTVLDMLVKDILGFTDKICPAAGCPSSTAVSMQRADTTYPEYCTLMKQLYANIPKMMDEAASECHQLPNNDEKMFCGLMLNKYTRWLIVKYVQQQVAITAPELCGASCHVN